MCYHVVRWRQQHRSEDSLAAWTIVQSNRSLLWSVASPKLLHFFSLVFKFHGDFDRAFKLANEFVVRHPEKPITRVMARLGAEVSFAQSEQSQCLRLLEMLTQSVLAESESGGVGGGSSKSLDTAPHRDTPELAGLFMLQCRMYEVAASGGRMPVNRGCAFKRRLPEAELATIYAEAWKHSEDYEHRNLQPAGVDPSEDGSSSSSSSSNARPTPASKKSGALVAAGAGGSQAALLGSSPPTSSKQVSRRVLSWIGDPAVWWAHVLLHYDHDEHFFAESFVQGCVVFLVVYVTSVQWRFAGYFVGVCARAPGALSSSSSSAAAAAAAAAAASSSSSSSSLVVVVVVVMVVLLLLQHFCVSFRLIHGVQITRARTRTHADTCVRCWRAPRARRRRRCGTRT
jgi:hypothetical protein